jgi:hypothetical protein
MHHPDDDRADGHAEVERLLRLAEGGDVEACLILAGGLRAIGLDDLAASLEAVSDPVVARRVAFLIDEQEHPDDGAGA